MALSSKIVLKGGSKRRYTYPAFKDLSIISKSSMLSPLSFILPIIVERLILGGLWFHIKLDRDLFTWSTKPAGTLRIEEMKIIFERAKLLIMVIFPKSVKSLEDQTLRHSFQGDKLFFKGVLLLKLPNRMRKKRQGKLRTLWASLCWKGLSIVVTSFSKPQCLRFWLIQI